MFLPALCVLLLCLSLIGKVWRRQRLNLWFFFGQILCLTINKWFLVMEKKLFFRMILCCFLDQFHLHFLHFIVTDRNCRQSVTTALLWPLFIYSQDPQPMVTLSTPPTPPLPVLAAQSPHSLYESTHVQGRSFPQTTPMGVAPLQILPVLGFF